MEKKREFVFDNCKFFLMLLVVVGHILELTDYQNNRALKTMVIMIYSFHMPLFVFISGYFSKVAYSKKMILDIAKNLLLPYVIFQTVLLVFVELWNGEKTIYLSYTTPFSMLWFIFSLIGWKLLLPLIHKSKFSLPVLFALGILVGYIPGIGTALKAGNSNVYVGAAYNASRFFSFFPFFLLGSKMAARKLPAFTRVHKSIACMVLIVAIVFTAVFFEKINYIWFIGRESYDKLGAAEWYAGIYRVLTYLISLVLCFAFLAITPKSNTPMISSMGRRTFYPYLLHGFFIFALRAPINYWFKLSEYSMVLPIISGCAITLLLSSRAIQSIFWPVVEPLRVRTSSKKAASLEQNS